MTTLLTFALTLIAAEVALRIASRYELIILSAPFDVLSQYRVDWHHDRPPNLDPFDDWRSPEGCHAPHVTIVIVGDSWMREPEFGRALLQTLRDATIPDASDGLTRCVRVINTGTGSFSPTPMVVRLREILKNVRPDIVLINIDETDLMDEWIRYRHSTVVSADGLPLAVPPFIPDLPEMIHHLTLEVVGEIPLYTIRLLERALLHGVFLPQVREVLRKRGMLAQYDTILAPQRTDNAEEIFREALALFKSRLEALIRLVHLHHVEAEIVFTHHPHSCHVSAGEPRCPFSVESVLRTALVGKNVKLLFARDEMEAVHGQGYRAEEVFVVGDPFSHLTANGRANYGRWVAKKLIEGGADWVAVTNEAAR